MARMRVFMVFVLAITAGGALAFGTYNYMQHLPARSVSIPTRPVVVAASDLDIGTELRREDLRIIDWPANGVPAAAIADPGERRHAAGRSGRGRAAHAREHRRKDSARPTQSARQDDAADAWDPARGAARVRCAGAHGRCAHARRQQNARRGGRRAPTTG